MERLDKEIIGYYASWQWYDRSKLAKPENMDFRKVTRVNFAFFQIDTSGNIWGTDDWADPRVLYGDVNMNAGSCTEGAPGCKCSWVKPEFKSCNYHIEGMGLISRVHGAGKEIWPSIGGWTLSDNFPAMAKDPISRRNFAANCVGLIKDYGFDGIDIDWEYPGYAEHSGTPDDIVSYPLLLEELRRALDELEEETGKHYGITSALPCGPTHLKNINVPELSKYLSELNLMTYDFHGAWDAYTGVNSALYDSIHDPEPGWSIDGCVKNWAERGAPTEKMNIGLGFYGRSFLNAKALHEPHGGTDDKTWSVDEGTPQYFNIMDQMKHMTYVWDDESMTPIAFFDSGGMVSYDDERSICEKTAYAIDNDLHGFIIWELSGDVMKDLNTPLLDMVNRKLVETHIDCANPFGDSTTSTTSTETTTKTTITTTTTTTENVKETSTTTTEKAEEISKATSAIGTNSDAQEMPAQTANELEEETHDPGKRKPVKKREKKPDVPFRPPKEEPEL
jgi:chitinase